VLLLGAGQNPLRDLAEHPIAQAWIAGPVQQAIRDKKIQRAVVMEGALVRIRPDGAVLADALGGPTPPAGHAVHRRLLRTLPTRGAADGPVWDAGETVSAHLRPAQADLAGGERIGGQAPPPRTPRRPGPAASHLRPQRTPADPLSRPRALTAPSFLPVSFQPPGRQYRHLPGFHSIGGALHPDGRLTHAILRAPRDAANAAGPWRILLSPAGRIAGGADGETSVGHPRDGRGIPIDHLAAPPGARETL